MLLCWLAAERQRRIEACHTERPFLCNSALLREIIKHTALISYSSCYVQISWTKKNKKSVHCTKPMSVNAETLLFHHSPTRIYMTQLPTDTPYARPVHPRYSIDADTLNPGGYRLKKVTRSDVW